MAAEADKENAAQAAPRVALDGDAGGGGGEGERKPLAGSLRCTFRPYTEAEAAALEFAALRAPLPVFSMLWLTQRRVVLAGGGGRQGSGVASGAVLCAVTDAPALAPLGALDSRDELVYCMAWSPARKEISAGVGAFNHVLTLGDEDTKEGLMEQQLVQTCEGDAIQSALTYDAAGDYLATGDEAGRVLMWELFLEDSPPRLLRAMSDGGKDMVLSLSFNQAATLLAAASAEKVARVWDAASGKLARELRLRRGGGDLVFRNVRFARPFRIEAGAQPEVLVAAMNLGARGAGFVGVWSADSWELLRVRQVSREPLVQSALSGDATALAVASNTGSVYVLSLPDLATLATAHGCHDLPPTSLAFSPDGRTLLSASADRSFKFTRVERRRCGNFTLVLLNALVVLLALAAHLLLGGGGGGEWGGRLSALLARFV
jgi:hypothetical protein